MDCGGDLGLPVSQNMLGGYRVQRANSTIYRARSQAARTLRMHSGQNDILYQAAPVVSVVFSFYPLVLQIARGSEYSYHYRGIYPGGPIHTQVCVTKKICSDG